MESEIERLKNNEIFRKGLRAGQILNMDTIILSINKVDKGLYTKKEIIDTLVNIRNEINKKAEKEFRIGKFKNTLKKGFRSISGCKIFNRGSKC